MQVRSSKEMPSEESYACDVMDDEEEAGGGADGSFPCCCWTVRSMESD